MALGAPTLAGLAATIAKRNGGPKNYPRDPNRAPILLAISYGRARAPLASAEPGPARKSPRSKTNLEDHIRQPDQARLVAHVTHAAHSTTRWHTRLALGFGPVSHHALGCDQQPSDRGGILQCHPHDLGRVDNAGCHHILVLAGL